MYTFVDALFTPVPEQKPTTKPEVLKMLDAIRHHDDIQLAAYLTLRRMIEALPTQEAGE